MTLDHSEASGSPQRDADHPAPPFAELTPERVLDALDSVLLPEGSRTDGRMLPLNSYENRVYQVGMEDGPPVVAKFYRPQRWSNQAILEEHAFVADLAQREIPAVPARVLNGTSLHAFEGFRFSIFERRGGRAPDIDRPDTLEWLGRFIGRIHAVGMIEPYRERPTLDIQSFGFEPREFLLTHGFIPKDVRPAYESVVQMALDGVGKWF
jgi:Ser/Thr protein kinase RdoA (MazF antagonist)